MSATTVRFKKLHPDVKLPHRAHENDAAMDVHAWLPDGPVVIPEGKITKVPSGFCMELELGFEAQIRPRSGLGSKGLLVPNAPGTIDAGFRGEVCVLLLNMTGEPFTISHGDRIAQMVIQELPWPVVLEQVEELSNTARGTGGFGSSGR